MHPEVTSDGGGACSRCGMPLASTTQELRWHCPDHGEERSEPGRCPKDGRPLIVRPVALPHGDHNPRHGGILFMAPDGFHHLEGALDSAGRFRLYLYDDFTRPLDARRFRARAGERPLMPAGDGGFLVLPEVFEKGRPVELTVHVAFPTSSPEARFDFVLEAPLANALAPLPPVPASADSAALLEGVRLRRRRLEELVRGGAWPDLYLPALEAKELALLLLDREGDRVAGPVKTLVRAGWLLDLHGDLGRREEVERAHRLFAQGVTDLEAALAR
jgi:hypothetical protein